jgi:aryl-phospho-beta-D-glucosidase BglC (GH1 family)
MLKSKRLLSAVLTLAILGGFSMFKPMVTNASIGSTDFLKVSGQVLKNNSGTGSVVQLKGTNLGGYMLQEDWMSPLGAVDDYTARTTLINRFGVAATDSLFSSYEDYWITTTDLDNIRNNGMNMVRLPIYWENVMNRDGSMKSNPWTKIDWIVNQCAARNIYVLLDLHGVPGGDDNWQSGGRVANELWSNSTYQTWTVNLWKAMAAHYNGNATVCGYDLLNEPVSNSSTITNSVFYNTLYQAVRSVDADHAIFIEAFYDFNYIVSPSTYGWTNVVYETHNYDTADETDTTKLLAFAYNQLAMLAKYKSQWNVPIYAGEYCYFAQTNVWQTWLAGLDSMGMSWTNWAYKVKANYGNWGFFNTDTNPSPDLSNDSQATILSKWSNFTTSNFTSNTTFQNLVKQYTGNTIPSLSGTVYLRAMANSNIISNDATGTNPLSATKTVVPGAGESYKVINNADGTISLQSMANNLYVCADLNNSTKLVPRSSAIGTWEEFKIVTQSDGTVALQALANNLYVTCDLNNGSVLYANKTSVGGAWEAFNFISNTIPSPSGTVYLRAVANTNIISNDTTGTNPLAATKTAVGGAWESYKVINNSDGTISLQSMANNLYVCADLNNSAKLIARSSAIGTWEKFNRVSQTDGTDALQALANNLYVSCDINNGSVLSASKTSVGGAWETFYLTPQ